MRRVKLAQTLRFFTGLIRSRFVTHRPCVLSHLVTARCNCRCDICLWRGHTTEELELGEIARIYGEARQHGIVFNYIWGGEPLVRADIDRVIAASSRCGFITLLNTNGYFLAERLGELGDTMDILVVSLDYPSEYHDELRRCRGLYRRVLEGIERTRATYPRVKVIINTVMTRYNHRRVEDIVVLAKDVGASIFVAPMETNSRHPSPEVLSKALLTDEEVSAVCERLVELKMEGYPINNSVDYLKGFIGGKKPYSCHYPQAVLTVNADGQVPNCVDRGRPLGNLRHMRIGDIFRSAYYRYHYLPQIKTCYRCNNSDVIDTSLLWELRPRILWEAVRLGLR